jgi:two-component system, cell cycle sensor histidine kinase and response regulator CckA
MKYKILIIDNNPVILKLISEIIEREGHEVKTAPDGLAGLNTLKSYLPDIIFTDLIMPNINGKKLCQIIRNNALFKNIFVVILSGIAAEEKLNPSEYLADCCIAKGAAKNITANIHKVIELYSQQRTKELAEKILGKDELYTREVTRELLDNKKHSDLVLENMNEAIIEITLNGQIISINKMAATLLEKKEEKLLTTPFIELFSNKDQEILKTIINKPELLPQKLDLNSPISVNKKQFIMSFFIVLDSFQKNIIIIMRDVSEELNAINEQKRLNQELKKALGDVKKLQGFLPICASCKSIRDDKGYWKDIEEYITKHSEAVFSHSICPNCAKKLYSDYL